MVGKIIKNISNDYTVLSLDKKYVCKASGKIRKLKMIPLVGDNVEFDEKNCYIEKILNRKNSLVRPPVSNVEQAFIITSVKQPDFSSNLLDKLLTIIEYNSITPIIVFTKLDLFDGNIDDIINYYKKIGYQVLKNTEIEEIKKTFNGKISVFTGQSGAGKSTLLNNIDKNLNIKTNEISIALGRGKHTTRHTELIEINGGYVADTPGFSALSFIDMKDTDIRDNFIEFNEYKHLCEYRDCMHKNEPVCGVKEKVVSGEILKSRYDNYLKFLEEGGSI